jgi:GH25 family lysozyme M1 (1,4-beta-N-acetylmuramidase)
MQITLVCVVTALLAATTLAAIGGDISGPMSTAMFKCLKQHNAWEFMVVRSYHSYGAPDPNAKNALANAKAAGIPRRDVYHFPCRSQSAHQQMANDIDAVGKENFHTMWLDIESTRSPSCGWDIHSKADNCKFIKELVDATQFLGVHVGVYSSAYEWGLTVGSDCASVSGVPLWFANYDGVPSNSVYSRVPFGGWRSAVAHQFADKTVTHCGSVNADADYADSEFIVADRKKFLLKINATQ